MSRPQGYFSMFSSGSFLVFSIYILIYDSYTSLGQEGVLNALPYGAILAEIARRQKTALAGHPLQPVGGVVGVEGRSQLFCF